MEKVQEKEAGDRAREKEAVNLGNAKSNRKDNHPILSGVEA